jgi:S-formylglutathione hydrolase FrmB
MVLQGDIYSETLNMYTGLSVFAPDALQARDNYKVVYLLHGLHGDNRTWLHNTMLPIIAKTFNAVFIMPEVGRTFYADMRYGPRYFSYISEELPAICRRLFNISGTPEDTAVMGCSMGGYGALKTALTKPDRYGFCAAISSACLFFDEILDALRRDPSPYLKTGPAAKEMVSNMHAIFGDDLRYASADVLLSLVAEAEKAPVKPKIYMACGTEDDLLQENRRFKIEMTKTAFDFEYEEWQGAHEWHFFNDALKKSLQKWCGN